MNKILAAVFLLGVLSGPAAACTGLIFYGVDANNNFTITLSSGTQTILFTNLPVGSGSKKAAALEAAVQALFDNRLSLVSLPLDDPDKVTNPDLPNIFWSLADGTAELNPVLATHVTSRSCRVTITWDGSKFVPRLQQPF
jgi:hypothetical protein